MEAAASTVIEPALVSAEVVADPVDPPFPRYNLLARTAAALTDRELELHSDEAALDWNGS